MGESVNGIHYNGISSDGVLFLLDFCIRFGTFDDYIGFPDA